MSKILQNKKILNVVKKTVADSVQGVLRDPDYGLEIRDSYAKKLSVIAKKPKSAKTRSLKDIKKRYL